VLVIVIGLHQSAHRVKIEFRCDTSTTNTGASRSPTLLNAGVKLQTGHWFCSERYY